LQNKYLIFPLQTNTHNSKKLKEKRFYTKNRMFKLTVLSFDVNSSLTFASVFFTDRSSIRRLFVEWSSWLIMLFLRWMCSSKLLIWTPRNKTARTHYQWNNDRICITVGYNTLTLTIYKFLPQPTKFERLRVLHMLSYYVLYKMSQKVVHWSRINFVGKWVKKQGEVWLKDQGHCDM